MPTTTITTEERAERKRLVDTSIHSGEMEGQIITAEARADSQDYIDGKIDPSELVARTRTRYGLA